MQQLPWFGFLQDLQHKNPNMFLFSNATFHTHQNLYLSFSSLCAICPHCSSGVLLHALSLFSLIWWPYLSVHSLSTVVFLLLIWIPPRPMHLLLLFCCSHLVLILRPIYASFLFDLFHYFIIWELYSFTSNYFSSLHGKNSTFVHSKLHPSISTKHMNSSHKCIHLFFTLEIIYEHKWFRLYSLFPHS